MTKRSGVEAALRHAGTYESEARQGIDERFLLLPGEAPPPTLFIARMIPVDEGY